MELEEQRGFRQPSPITNSGDVHCPAQPPPMQGQRQLLLIRVIVLTLGIWGALVPFVGPTFDYGMGGTAAWTWSESHVTLHLLPGLAAIAGVVLLLRGSFRRAVPRSDTGHGGWHLVRHRAHPAPLWGRVEHGRDENGRVRTL